MVDGDVATFAYQRFPANRPSFPSFPFLQIISERPAAVKGDAPPAPVGPPLTAAGRSEEISYKRERRFAKQRYINLRGRREAPGDRKKVERLCLLRIVPLAAGFLYQAP